MFDNNYGIKKITLKQGVHCYCTLGEELYTGELVIRIKNPSSIPDYCDVNKYISSLEGSKLIIEELTKTIYDYIKKVSGSDKVMVSTSVNDAYKHMPVEVVIDDEDD